MFDKNIIVTSVAAAMFLPGRTKRPILKNRPTHGLVLNLGCSADYFFDTGERLTVRSGECIYLPRGSNYTGRRYDISETRGSGVYAINFSVSDDALGDARVVRVKGLDELVSLFLRAASAWIRQDAGYYEECMGCLYRIIRRLKKEASRSSGEKRAQDKLAPALLYIEKKYTQETIPISTLAELSKVSEPYLRRLFHTAFSVSPAIYIRNMRIKYAKELLRSGECSVTDAAILSGFNDAAYFSREFKKIEGVSPAEYMKSTE